MPGSWDDLHPIERKLIALLESSERVTIESLGSVNDVASAAGVLSVSPLLPAALSVYLDLGRQVPSLGQVEFEAVFKTLLEGATDEFVLTELVDQLDAERPLPFAGDEICFSSLLAKAGDGRLSGLARGIALEGSFRWAVSNRRWQLKLIDHLLGLSATENIDLLRRSAKLCGLAHANWNEDGLLAKLRELCAIADCAADASFELGMASLGDGLNATGIPTATAAFLEARSWFAMSAESTEINPEAELFRSCLDVLNIYLLGQENGHIQETLTRISTSAFELDAWFGRSNVPQWLGARRLQSLHWSQLALALDGLIQHIDAASWWEPAAIIEKYVLAVYSANRTILGRSNDGILNVILRPRIVASLATHLWRAHLLKTWVTQNLRHEYAAEANALLSDIDLLIADREVNSNPTDAAIGQDPFVALIDKRHLPDSAKATMVQLISNALALHIDNMTQTEIDTLLDVRDTASTFPDHQTNPHARRLFDTILVWLLRFLTVRLELTQADDPTGQYLFRQIDGKNVSEDLLQHDFFRFLAANLAGADIEADNVGSGRADIRSRSSSERIVVEVKRELRDASFDSLASAYQAQTTDYQNVSVRMGFLLVLDLTSVGGEGTPHLRTLVQARSVRRSGENFSRLIVIVKIPGNRNRPSDLTKLAKKRKK